MTDDTKPNHGPAREWAELIAKGVVLAHVPGSSGHNLARAYLASQAELAKERERGNALNARNGRMEGELSLLKPESAAKAAMEAEYADMKSELAASQAENAELKNGGHDYDQSGDCRRCGGEQCRMMGHSCAEYLAGSMKAEQEANAGLRGRLAEALAELKKTDDSLTGTADLCDTYLRERNEARAERDMYKTGFENAENALDAQLESDAVIEMERNALREALGESIAEWSHMERVVEATNGGGLSPQMREKMSRWRALLKGTP